MDLTLTLNQDPSILTESEEKKNQVSNNNNNLSNNNKNNNSQELTLKKLLNFLELSSKQLDENQETLFIVVDRYRQQCHYSNCRIMKVRKSKNRYQATPQISAVIEEVSELVINRGIGTHCIALHNLLQELLISLGFKVIMIQAELIFPGMVLNNKNQENELEYHSVLIVHLNEQIFLLELGLGAFSVKYPIEVDINQLGKIEFVNWGYQYLVDVKDSHFQLMQWLPKGEKWFPLIRINFPFQPMNEHKFIEEFLAKENMQILDEYLLLGKFQDNFKVYLEGFPFKENPSYVYTVEKNGGYDIQQTKIKSKSELVQLLKSEFNENCSEFISLIPEF